jgi:hypothetical protein
VDAERQRLAESEARTKHWRRWGPYLTERAWGNVREDYSPDGSAWTFFPHDHARSRTYRWTEDGLLGICDNHQYLCFALALWNGHDRILKERLFGLSGIEGNHGEDVKEVYYYLDATPTSSYLKGLYKYPQAEFPYDRLVAENARRTRQDPEFELEDTGVFDQDRYFDVFAEYAKNDFDDVLVRIRVVNRGPERADLTVLPTLWFRNTWDWDGSEEPETRPLIVVDEAGSLLATHAILGRFVLQLDGRPETLFTDNETNSERLWGVAGREKFTKDAFHEYLLSNCKSAVNPAKRGTKAAALYRFSLESEERRVLRFRLFRFGLPQLAPSEWDGVFDLRQQEADRFYHQLGSGLNSEAQNVQRQAFAGLFWSKQFYHFVIEPWLAGDPGQPEPPESRKQGRNHTWRHLFN